MEALSFSCVAIRVGLRGNRKTVAATKGENGFQSGGASFACKNEEITCVGVSGKDGVEGPYTLGGRTMA